MQIVDDTQLIALARKPAGELFVSFRSIGAFAPLLAVLCIVPPLFAVTHATATDADALWGLRALAYVPGDWPPSLLRSPEEGLAGALRWHPPLGSWITAGVVKLLHRAGPATLLASSFLATAACIAMLLLLLRSVASDRMALWAGVLAAGHAPLLLQSTRMAPVALGMFLALASFWGFLGHLEWGTRRVSLRLILGGISLGLCALAAGPLALGVTAALLLFVLGLRGESLSRRKYADPRPIRVWRGWSALRSLAVLLVIALAAGGFWPLERWWNEGSPFLSSWMFGTVPADSAGLVAPELLRSDDPTRSLASRGMQRLLEAQGPLLPGSLCGLALALRGVATMLDEKRRRTMLFLVSWVTNGLIGWLLAARRTEVLPHLLELWECYLSLGLTACGACFLEEVSLRTLRLGPAAVVLVAGVAVLAFAGRHFESPLLLAMARVLLVALFAGVGMVLASYLREERVDRDLRQQVILTALVLAVLTASVATGITSLRRATGDDRTLGAFRRALPGEVPVTHCTVLGDPERLPPRLRLAVLSAWPECRFESAASWDAAVALSLTTAPDRQSAIILDWGRTGATAVNLQVPGVHIAPVASPQIFAGGALRAMIVTRETASLAGMPRSR